LGGGHEHGTHTIRAPASHQTSPTLLSRHSYQPVHGILVIPTLGRRKRGVVLHAYVQHVSGVSGNTAQEAGGGGHGDERGKGGGGAGGGEGRFKFLVNAEAGGGVG